ncbi:MAG: aminotransferase class IV [Spirochaetaceae bacterium]|jgi:D-alanine transaminase|nr:aminotransferase class IV [Spirochaetaceae bacterium]
MENLGYYNGETGPIEEMKVPMDDRSSWFGDGVYDATISADHIVYALEEHVDRFFNSMALLKIEPDFTQKELAALLSSLVKKVDSPVQMVYWQVTRGTAPRAHAFPQGARPNLWIFLRPWKTADPARGQKLVTVEDTRFFHCNIKTLNLIPNVLAAEDARKAGCDEAVFHRSGRVTECSRSNVHILKDGVFRTAPADSLILAGIGRAHIMALCGKLGVPVDETPFSVQEMMAADEVLITSSGVFCLAATHVNGMPVGGRAPALVGRLRDALIGELWDYIAARGGAARRGGPP